MTRMWPAWLVSHAHAEGRLPIVLNDFHQTGYHVWAVIATPDGFAVIGHLPWWRRWWSALSG